MVSRYQQRDAVLAEMGFPTYLDYLRSPLYRSIRARIFKVCDRCVCGKPATELHHRSYKRRYLEGRGKIHKFITPVCREHHESIEFDEAGKLPLGWANAKLDAIRAEAEARGIVMPHKTRIKRRKSRMPAGQRSEGLAV